MPCGTEEPLSLGLSVCLVFYVYLYPILSVTEGVTDVHKFLCVCACAMDYKKGHLNFNVSKVQNCMLRNCTV